MQSVYQQFLNFTITVGIGLLVGLIFDVYRVARGFWQPKKWGTLLGDLLFWVLITILAFTLLLMGNWGEVRIYVFLGIALGFIMYLKYCTVHGQKVISRIFYLIFKTLRFLWLVITWPFKIIYKIILVPLGFLVTGILAVAAFGQRVLRSLKFKIKGIAKKLLFLFKKKRDDDEE